jgi:hypothetical protein
MCLPQRFKPQSKPEWMSVEEYAALPDMLEVRELRYKISRSGFRTRDATRVTTLLDAEVYTAAQLTCLHGARWGVKADLKHLKQTMKRDVLKCKRVEGVLKELTVYALVGNMVRLLMAEAGGRQEVTADGSVLSMRYAGCSTPRQETSWSH